MEQALNKREVISLLTKSPHGKLEDYLEPGLAAVKADPEFFAHLIAWNARNGQIRDAKVALPAIALHGSHFHENGFAHLAQLDPRNLVRAYRFSGDRRKMKGLVRQYLGFLEFHVHRWDRSALQHRDSLKSLYALTHTKPSDRAQKILFERKYPAGSAFMAVAALSELPVREAAALIVQHKIPFLIARGALGKKASEPDTALALLEAMSPTEVVTNAKSLKKWGVKNSSVLRAAFEKKLEEVSTSGQNTLKTARAAAALGTGSIATKLNSAQERQISRGVEGDWAVFVDKSSSMKESIEVGRQVAALLARSVQGKVWLVFFDNFPRAVEATGKSLEEIKALTAAVSAGGGTSIGAPLQWLLEQKLGVDGIAIVSDGGEGHHPAFAAVWPRYVKALDCEPTVYLYEVAGDPNYFTPRCEASGIQIETFNLRGGVDYYSLPTLVQTMNVKRYTLVDQIMATPLLTLAEVFK